MPADESDKPMSRGHLQIPRDTFRKVKIIASIQDRPVGSVAAELIENAIKALPRDDRSLSMALAS